MRVGVAAWLAVGPRGCLSPCHYTAFSLSEKMQNWYIPGTDRQQPGSPDAGRPDR